MARSEVRSKYEALIAECDDLIKSGRVSLVGSRISGLNFAQVPRSLRQSLAKICRRAGLVHLGLRLLKPVIRSQRGNPRPATAGEICEYAVLLSRNGSVQEAMSLLVKVDPKQAPEASLYLGYCHIATWEYASAAEYFSTFSKATTDSYLQLIAQVNLVSCYIVVGRYDEALALLPETMRLAEKHGAQRLLGNAFELQAQIYLQQSMHQECRASLERARTLLGQSQSHDQLLILKSECIMEALESKSATPLQRFREEAIRRKHWDSVREADLYMLKIAPDQTRLDHLVFGTPMNHYRERIINSTRAKPGSSYIFGSAVGRCLDLSTGTILGKNDLKPGRKIHQVLSALVKDFYVPMNIGALFSELYPDEYFDVDTSPYRVRQLILRTRKWLQRNRIPANIEHIEGAYRLVVHGDFGIRISLVRGEISGAATKWQGIKAKMSEGIWFTVEEACQLLECSRSTFHRLAEWAISEGELEKRGVGKSTAYRLPKTSSVAKTAA